MGDKLSGDFKKTLEGVEADWGPWKPEEKMYADMTETQVHNWAENTKRKEERYAQNPRANGDGWFENRAEWLKKRATFLDAIAMRKRREAQGFLPVRRKLAPRENGTPTVKTTPASECLETSYMGQAFNTTPRTPPQACSLTAGLCAPLDTLNGLLNNKEPSGISKEEPFEFNEASSE